MSDEKVYITLRRTVGIRTPGQATQYYGPGRVLVPQSVAETLGIVGDATDEKEAQPEVDGAEAGTFPTDRATLEQLSKDALQSEADRRQLVVFGTGANENVLKEDLINALAKD